jgi:DNA (cytosine-5)-methyltransferase 1
MIMIRFLSDDDPLTRARGVKMTFGSLFAGIGGFDLGLERAGMECKWQVEIDDFCNRVLEKHWPHVKRYRDVREVGKHNLEPVDLICGGFPCQDVSVAGRREGIGGERSGLWSEYHRVVCELRPQFVIVENVSGLLLGGLGKVLGDLAEIGYDAEWECISAASVGALHNRDRVWIIAYPDTDSVRLERIRPTKKESWPREQFEGLVQAIVRSSIPTGRSGGMAHGVRNRPHRLRSLGNAVVPQVVEIIGRAIMAVNP